MNQTSKPRPKTAPIRPNSSKSATVRVVAPVSGELLASECARRLGITPQSVGAWAVRPGAPARVQGANVYLQWPAFARWREQELVRQAKEEAAPLSLIEAQTRRAVAQAKEAELDLAEREGQLVTVEDYGTALGRILDRLMARLRAVPVRMAHHGPEVEASLEREVEAMIVELSAFDDDVLEEAA
jgi:hypothetical protein